MSASRAKSKRQPAMVLYGALCPKCGVGLQCYAIWVRENGLQVDFECPSCRRLVLTARHIDGAGTTITGKSRASTPAETASGEPPQTA